MKWWNQAAVDIIDKRRADTKKAGKLCTVKPAKICNAPAITTWNTETLVVFIGIDCGVHTGIAIWNKTKQCFDLIKTTTMTQAQDIVRQYVLAGHTVTVRVEDARKRKWYGKDAAAKKQGAGSVKRDGSNWEAFLKENGITHEMVHPIKGLTKKNKTEFFQMTGYTGLTSEHGRDAAMLVYML